MQTCTRLSEDVAIAVAPRTTDIRYPPARKRQRPSNSHPLGVADGVDAGGAAEIPLATLFHSLPRGCGRENDSVKPDRERKMGEAEGARKKENGGS